MFSLIRSATFMRAYLPNRVPNICGKYRLASLSAGRTSFFSRPCSTASTKVLEGRLDMFGGVNIDLDPVVGQAAEFHARLQTSLAEWRKDDRLAVWVKVPHGASAAIPALVSEGFDYHHAQPGYALLTLWLQQGTDSRLPKYAKHQVGVGGLVFSPSGKDILLMMESKNVKALDGKWKLPGGLVDAGEDLVDAVKREVREETGIEAEAEGVMCFHHRHNYRFGVSDLYFTVRMQAKTSELQADPNEVKALTWMPYDAAFEDEKVTNFTKHILRSANKNVMVPAWGTHGAVTDPDHFFYGCSV